MNEKKDVEKYCQTIIRVYEILPYSEYITNGYYAIATNKPIQLTQACKQLSASIINVKAPLDIVQLKTSCSMTRQHLILPAYYYKESKYNLTEHLTNWINDFKPSQVKIWEPLRNHYPNFSIEKLPPKLKDIKEIKISDLINKLKDLDTVAADDHVPIWPFRNRFSMFRHCFRSVLLVKKFEKLGESAKFGSPDVLNKIEMQMLKRVPPSKGHHKKRIC